MLVVMLGESPKCSCSTWRICSTEVNTRTSSMRDSFVEAKQRHDISTHTERMEKRKAHSIGGTDFESALVNEELRKCKLVSSQNIAGLRTQLDTEKSLYAHHR